MKETKLEVGDKVIVRLPESVKDSVAYNKDMKDNYDNTEQTITDIKLNYHNGIDIAKLDGCEWVWDLDWLEKVPEEELPYGIEEIKVYKTRDNKFFDSLEDAIEAHKKTLENKITTLLSSCTESGEDYFVVDLRELLEKEDDLLETLQEYYSLCKTLKNA